jgi:hypothetical protein
MFDTPALIAPAGGSGSIFCAACSKASAAVMQATAALSQMAFGRIGAAATCV